MYRLRRGVFIDLNNEFYHAEEEIKRGDYKKVIFMLHIATFFKISGSHTT